MLLIQRLRTAAFWLIPPLVCLAIYWPGLIAWFQQDDFAWLLLLNEVREGRTLVSALFTPQAQGSLRPLGERTYFLGLHALFGLNALPFRALAFLVQFGSMALVMIIVRRMTGSRWAGLAAAVLWIANHVLFIVMTWSAEFMLGLCAFFLLLALDQFQRYAGTGARRHLAGCWAAFLIGFGALESNAVFPLLAASWAFLFARKHIWRTLPMFGVSAAYTVMHMVVAPKSTDSVYAIKIGWHMLRTLRTYWELTFVPEAVAAFSFSQPVARRLLWVFTVVAVGYVVFQFRKGRRQPLWFLVWFGITILPVLPLPRHILEYYLTLPALGVAMLAADALVRAWNSGWAARTAAAALAAAFLLVQVPCAYGASRWWYERSIQGRNWLAHAQRTREQHPGKSIVYQGFEAPLYYNAVTNGALNLIGAYDVWIAPGNARKMGDLDNTSEYVSKITLAPELARRLFEQSSLMAFDIQGPAILPITDPKELEPELRVVAPVFSMNLGERVGEWRLAKGWHLAQEGDRWMSARSVTRISCADPAASELFLHGRVPAGLLAHGPAKLAVILNGRPAGSANLTTPDSAFDLAFPLPPGVAGSENVELRLECDRSFRAPPDERDLSVLFGVIGVRKARGGAKP